MHDYRFERKVVYRVEAVLVILLDWNCDVFVDCVNCMACANLQRVAEDGKSVQIDPHLSFSAAWTDLATFVPDAVC